MGTSDAKLLAVVLATFLALALLSLWMFAYPAAPFSLLFLGLVGLVAAVGQYQGRLLRRRAILDAALVHGTRAHRVFRGGILALIATLTALIVALPPAAFFVLTAASWQVGLVAGLALSSASLCLLFLRIMKRQVQGIFLTHMAPAWAAWLSALGFALAHAWVMFDMPPPAWCSADGWPTIVSGALADMPGGQGLLAELFAIFRLAEAAAWCAVLPEQLEWAGAIVDFEWVRAGLILVQSSVVFWGLGSIIAGFQMLFLRVVVKPANLSTDESSLRGSGTVGPENLHVAGRSNANRIGERAFWITLCALLAVMVSLAFLAAVPSQDPIRRDIVSDNPIELDVPREVALPATRIEELARLAAMRAYETTSVRSARELDRLFDPVHAAVEDYADFHFSMLGEYSVLLAGALKGSANLWERLKVRFRDGEAPTIDAETQEEVTNLLERAASELESGLYERLYGGFDERAADLADRLDALFFKTFEATLRDLIKADIHALGEGTVLAKASQAIIEDTLDRAQFGKPLSATLATGAGAATGRVLATTLSKAALKSGLKFGGKAVGKGAATGSGASLGALIGAPAGPLGAAVGGVVGALATWFAVDYAVVKIDEARNRDEFEAELHALIDVQRAEVETTILDALDASREALSSTSLIERTR